jgi:hypothetical protein
MKHTLIAGVICLSLFSACSKTTPVAPKLDPLSETSNTVVALATQPVGTVVYTSNGYTLTFVNNDATFDQAEYQTFINTFFTVYPQILNRFYTGARKSVKFTIDPTYTGVAYTSGGASVFSSAWFHSNPQDIDVITHEVTHIVQAYTTSTPGWLTEGIADYSRYKFGVNNAAAGWSLPAWSSSQSYTDSYRVTARFLAWLELHKSSTIVNSLNTALRNGTYTNSTWSTLTGETVTQLWADYSASPAL